MFGIDKIDEISRLYGIKTGKMSTDKHMLKTLKHKNKIQQNAHFKHLKQYFFHPPKREILTVPFFIFNNLTRT